MNSLEKLQVRAWAHLAEGVAPGRSDWSMLYLATRGLDDAPRSRTVVLRSLDEAGRILRFNSDLRSPKIAEIDADPRVTLLGYSRDAGFQIRIEGQATILRDGEARQRAWEASAAHSRVCYRHAYGPSAPLKDPADGDPTDAMRAPEDYDAGLENFSAVEIIATSLDVLDLGAGGHRRAIFEASGDWRGRWVAP